MGNSEREWAKSYDRNSTKRKVEAVPGIHRAVRAKAASDLAEADVELRRFHPSAALGRRPPPPPAASSPGRAVAVAACAARAAGGGGAAVAGGRVQPL